MTLPASDHLSRRPLRAESLHATHCGLLSRFRPVGLVDLPGHSHLAKGEGQFDPLSAVHGLLKVGGQA